MEIEKLILTKNCQFFKLKHQKDFLPKEKIELLLAKASAHKKGNCLVKHTRLKFSNDQIEQSYYSVRVFKTERQVYFLDENIFDVVHAFVVIIELKGYVAIFHKSCQNFISLLQNDCILIKNNELTNIFNDETAEFKKLRVRNMSITNSSIRNKQFEARNLDGALSCYGLNRSIPTYLQIQEKDDGVRKSFNTSTGRYIEQSARNKISELVSWVNDKVNLLIRSSTNPNKNFLNQFAKNIELKQVIDSGVKCQAILIESELIFEKLNIDVECNESSYNPLHYKKKSGEEPTPINNTVFKHLKDYLENIYNINSENNEYVIDVNLKGYIDKKHKNKIRINKNISLFSPLLQKFGFYQNTKFITLTRLINENGFFSIVFDDPSYFYHAGSCYKDETVKNAVDSALKIFRSDPLLNNVKSEKGSDYTADSTAFSNNSIFFFVENTILCDDDFIICDDLGNEWADHISMNYEKKTINFIHSKHGKKANSASKLHDVISQAEKNIGNMFFTEILFSEKMRKHNNSFYKINQIVTRINTIRKTNDLTLDQLKDEVNSLLSSFDIKRRCMLCCSFISFSDIQIEFNKIKNGELVSGHINQMLWLIMSFIHTTKEHGIEPIIYCCE